MSFKIEVIDNHMNGDNSANFAAIRAAEIELGKVIKGRDDTIRLLLVALIIDGHVLIEDYPGSGKTTLVKALGRVISTETDLPHFKRIQSSPDMLPGDILGVSIFDSATKAFRFNRGPVFSHIVLADEINRAGPKVQSAFLECMAEKQVTIDNETYVLDELFFVVATQNPLDMQGTYPLPAAQLDRFFMKIGMPYVDKEYEYQILAEDAKIDLSEVITRQQILDIRREVSKVKVNKNLRKGLIRLAELTRDDDRLKLGISTRALQMLQAGIRGAAYLNSRDYASDQDLKMMVKPILNHRLVARRDVNEIIEEHLHTVVEELHSGRFDE